MAMDIYFHGDADGCCSAAIVRNCIKECRLHPVVDQSSLEKEVHLRRADTLILDLGTPKVELMKKLGKGGRVLVIDHHVPPKEYPQNYINSRLHFSKPYPTSIIVYDFFPDERLDWVAAAGLVGDWSAGLLPGLIKQVGKKYPGLVKHKTQEEIYFKDKLGEIARGCDCCVSVYGKRKGIYVTGLLLKCAGNPEKFLADKAIKTSLRTVDKEIRRALRNVRVENKLASIEFKSKYRLKSQVVQRLKMEYPGKITMVSQKRGGEIDFSLRGGGAVLNLDSLVRTCMKGLKGSGGGHPEAVGGRVAEADYLEFRERLGKRIGKIS